MWRGRQSTHGGIDDLIQRLRNHACSLSCRDTRRWPSLSQGEGLDQTPDSSALILDLLQKRWDMDVYCTGHSLDRVLLLHLLDAVLNPWICTVGYSNRYLIAAETLQWNICQTTVFWLCPVLGPQKHCDQILTFIEEYYSSPGFWHNRSIILLCVWSAGKWQMHTDASEGSQGPTECTRKGMPAVGMQQQAQGWKQYCGVIKTAFKKIKIKNNSPHLYSEKSMLQEYLSP